MSQNLVNYQEINCQIVKISKIAYPMLSVVCFHLFYCLLFTEKQKMFVPEIIMKCDCDDAQEPSTSSTNVVFEASTQTPTTETCDSPLFSQQGYCLKTDGHSNNALNNIHKMKQHGQVKAKRHKL